MSNNMQSLSFEELLKLEAMKQTGEFQRLITALVVIGLVAIIGLLYADYKCRQLGKVVEGTVAETKVLMEDMKKEYKDAKVLVVDTVKDVSSATRKVEGEINKTMLQRLEAFIEAPAATMVLCGGCILLARELIFRRARRVETKESMEMLRSSNIMKLFDAILALMILPAIYTHGVKFAVEAWKSASVVVRAFKTMLAGLDIVKSVFGTEHKTALVEEDGIVQDIDEALDGITARVGKEVKEALLQSHILRHDKSKDKFKNFHECNENCAWQPVNHYTTCGLTQAHREDKTAFYKCSCLMMTPGATVPENAIDKPSYGFVYDGKEHKTTCMNMTNIKTKILLMGPDWVGSEGFMMCGEFSCCAKAQIAHHVVSNVYKTSSSILKDVLEGTKGRKPGDTSGIGFKKNEIILGNETDDEDDLAYESEIKDDPQDLINKLGEQMKEAQSLRNEEREKVTDYLVKEKRKNKFTKMLEFLQKPEGKKYWYVAGIMMAAVFVAYLIYNQRKIKSEKKEAIKKEGKNSDLKRAAMRAQATHKVRTKPWWIQSSTDDDQQDDNERSVYRGNGKDEEDPDEDLMHNDRQEARITDVTAVCEAEDRKRFSLEATVAVKQDLENSGFCRFGDKCVNQKPCKRTHVNVKTCKCGFRPLCTRNHKIKYVEEFEKKIRQISKKSHEKDMARVKGNTVKSVSFAPEVKEAIHNKEQMLETQKMRDSIGWCTTNGGLAQNITLMWSGFVVSRHVFGTTGTVITAHMRLNNIVQKGNFVKTDGIYFTHDHYYFKFSKCLSNDAIKLHTLGGNKWSAPLLSAKVKLLTFNSEQDFIDRKFVSEQSTILSLDELVDAEGTKYLQGATKNSTVTGNCGGAYFDFNGNVVGIHNSRKETVNCFIGLTQAGVVKATGSPLN